MSLTVPPDILCCHKYSLKKKTPSPTLSLISLFCIFALHGTTSAFLHHHSIIPTGHYSPPLIVPHHQDTAITTSLYATFKISPAAVSSQDAETVRRILKQRSNRGREGTNPEVEKQPTRKQKPLQRRNRLKSSISDDKMKASSSSLAREEKSSTAATTTATNLGRTSKGYDLSYESTINALEIYYKENSNLILPRRFVIPEDCDKYPKEWHGIDLSGTVYDMEWWQRHVKQKPDRVAQLNKMGFVWERLQPEWNLVLEALITYQAIHGNLLVPAKFVVPYNDNRWPTATWGSNLGNSVYRIRNRGDFLQGNNSGSRRDQLDSIGFVWDVHEHRFKKFYKALTIYSQLENRNTSNNIVVGAGASGRQVSLKVPSTFAVPENSEEWPEEFWGYNLGRKCSDVRQKQVYVKGHPERLKMLADVGFQIGGNDSLAWLSVVHAAAVYSQMNQRKLDVPVSFVVPAPPRRLNSNSEDSSSDDNLTSSSSSSRSRKGGLTTTSVVGSDEAWPWPDYLWGFPLGQRLKDIRLKGYYLRGDQADTRRRQLDALGFIWTPRRGRPSKRKPTD